MHRLMIVGESPSKTRPEGQEEIAFSGQTSHILWDELAHYGITRKDCYVTNVIINHLNGEEPTEEQKEINHKRLDKEISEEQPLVILAVGRKSVDRLLEEKIESIVSACGSIRKNKYGVIVPCIHPAAIARNLRLKDYFVDSIYVAAETLKAMKESKDNIVGKNK